jgi:hypothetical protein
MQSAPRPAPAGGALFCVPSHARASDPRCDNAQHDEFFGKMTHDEAMRTRLCGARPGCLLADRRRCQKNDRLPCLRATDQAKCARPRQEPRNLFKKKAAQRRPSLGRKRPRRACGEPTPHAHHIGRAVVCNSKIQIIDDCPQQCGFCASFRCRRFIRLISIRPSKLKLGRRNEDASLSLGQFPSRPLHGTGCSRPAGDRTLADFLASDPAAADCSVHRRTFVRS